MELEMGVGGVGGWGGGCKSDYKDCFRSQKNVYLLTEILCLLKTIHKNLKMLKHDSNAVFYPKYQSKHKHSDH
jgi:hypothetical protein